MEILTILFLLCLAAFLYFLCSLLFKHFKPHVTELERSVENPILEPIVTNWWESEAVFNPAAVYEGGRVHLLYRALGTDGVSRIGYASSPDGIHFDERLPYPVFTPSRDFSTAHAGRVYPALSYDTHSYASGGGWGGSEDPRIVSLDGKLYMTFTAFDGWGFLRMAMSSILTESFLKKQWHWHTPVLLSPPGEIHKNWLIFPEKINGKYAILHSVTPEIKIEYVESLSVFNGHHFISGSTRSGGRKGHWDTVVRGAGAPPIKTKAGWLLLYHGFDERHPEIGYKVGAMLLDLKDPTKITYRSSSPILESKEWYENDWKPGVTYASGVVIVGKDLLVYYGGGDRRIAVAKMNLTQFLGELTLPENKV